MQVHDWPNADNAWHTCTVGILPPPVRRTGMIDGVAGVQWRTVRIATARTRWSRRIQVHPQLLEQLALGAAVCTALHTRAVTRGQRRLGGELQEVTMVQHPVAQRFVVPGDAADLAPLVEFGYGWSRGGLGDPRGWLGEHDRVIAYVALLLVLASFLVWVADHGLVSSAIFEYRIKAVLAASIRDMTECMMELTKLRRELQNSGLQRHCPALCNMSMVTIRADHCALQRVYKSQGERTMVWDIPCLPQFGNCVIA